MRQRGVRDEGERGGEESEGRRGGVSVERRYLREVKLSPRQMMQF
jgi:hypothetical protein